MAHYTYINGQGQPPPQPAHVLDPIPDSDTSGHTSLENQSYGYGHIAGQTKHYEHGYEYGYGQDHQYLPVFPTVDNVSENMNGGYTPATTSRNTDVSRQAQYFGAENSSYPSSVPQDHDHVIAQAYSGGEQQYANGQEYPSGWQYGDGQEYMAGWEYGYGKANDYVYPATQVTPSSDILVKRRCGLSFIHRLWIWEILSSVFSLACISSVIGVLCYEQGRPLDQWQQGWGQQISPTAVVSFLGMMGKSACSVAVAEIISQLKWIHFSAAPRKLSDLEIFDEASRGPWGAIRLVVLKNRTTLLAMCASVLLLASLFVDPFLQLVFTFPQQLTPVPGASPIIRTSQVYDPFALPSRFSQCYGSAQVDSAMQAAILSPVWNSMPPPSLPCNFENCEWSAITTLGVCSSCFDFTDAVLPNCSVIGNGDRIQCNYTIPDVTTLSADFAVTGGAAERTPYQTLWHSSAERLTPTESQDARIGRFGFIRFAANLAWQKLIVSDGDSPHVSSPPPVDQAMQCSFSLCARTFNSIYYANFSAGPLTGPSTPLLLMSDPNQPYSDRVLYQLSPSISDYPPMNTTFAINECDFRNLVDYLVDLFTVEYWSAGMSGSSGNVSPQTPITPNIGLALSQVNDTAALMQSIADSMTEAFRTSVNSTDVGGIGKNTVTYIAITWAWLVLPISLVVLTFIMLLVIIARNNARGVPIWKSSSLALLFHELQGWDEPNKEVRSPQDVKKRGSEMTGQVVNDGGVPSFYKV
ncbi:hypothetical protein F5Y04DRAFT_293067 [Hypomontagnella monticulosa]|nr:hypothetical protein F5Y04DRAFT_293067 [Hypomontagnella monticulosa]